jgi:hypothetical protein
MDAHEVQRLSYSQTPHILSSLALRVDLLKGVLYLWTFSTFLSWVNGCP